MLVRFVDDEGDPVWINPAHVVYVSMRDCATGQAAITVRDDPDHDWLIRGDIDAIAAALNEALP